MPLLICSQFLKSTGFANIKGPSPPQAFNTLYIDRAHLEISGYAPALSLQRLHSGKFIRHLHCSQ